MSNLKAVIREPEKNTEKAEIILAGVLPEFLKNGYMGTSVDKLAKAAGVSKATLYSYFDDKETLFKAVISRRFEELQRDFYTLPEEIDTNQDPQISLREIFTFLLEQMLSKAEQHDDFFRLLIGESGRFPELAQEGVHCFHKPIINQIAHFLASHPQIKCDNPQLSATTVMASLIYYIMTQRIFQAGAILPIDKEDYLDNLVRIICI